MDKSQRFATAVRLLGGLLLISLFSCSREKKDTFTDESVQQAAQRYYTYFINGDAKQYVEGMEGSENFTEDCSMQMRDVISHASKELAKRGRVVRVEALADSLYQADSTAYVYLDLVFADSIHEQIGVPMAYERGLWRVR